MIVEWFMSVASGFAGWLATLFPEFEEASWMTDPLGPLYGTLTFLSSLGTWVDIVAIAGIGGFVLSLYGVAYLIKLIRVLIAHVPFFGGRG